MIPALLRSAILAFALVPAALAGVTGKIVGQITDSAGEALPGVNVKVLDKPWGGASDLDGEYMILNLQPGIYTLEISSLGYAPVVIEQVPVSVDLSTRQDVVLRPTRIEGEVVTIVAERSIIQEDQTFSASYVDAQELASMPVTELSQVVDLQAGVVDGHFRGGRSGEVLYLVDGIPVTDVYDGSKGVEVQVSMVQELQVISGTFNAEYGQAMSGVVNTITRDGQERYEGSLNFYAGDYVSDHQNQFWNIRSVEPLNINNVEANLSGPVPLLPWLKFNGTVRLSENGGWYAGRRLFSPQEQYFFFTDETGTTYAGFNGDDIYGSVYWLDENGEEYWFFWDELLDDIFYEYIASGVWISEQDDGDKSAQSFWTGHWPMVTARDSQIVREFIQFADEYSRYVHERSSGDLRGAEYVKMNTEQRRSGQFKLTTDLSPTSKLRFNVIAADRHYREYSDSWRFTPDGRLKRYSRQQNTSLKWDQVFGGRTFFDLSLSHSLNSYYHRLYDSILDSRYVNTDELPDNGFYYYDLGGFDVFEPGYTENALYVGFANIGGTENAHFARRTDSWQVNGNLSRQAGKIHQLKAGLELRLHKLYFNDRNASFNGDEVVAPEGANYDVYTRYPWEGSIFLQDKMEFRQVTVNTGLRLDVFDANWRLPADLADPNNSGWRDVSLKWQASPRLAIAYPVTDTGVIHFSYGHFFQRPSFERLYQNPDFELEGINSLMGNPDLKVEKTVQYEIGLQQQLGEDVGVDISLYSRDIRDLVSSDRVIETVNVNKYFIFTNRDFGTVRGIVLSLDKRYGNNFNAGLDYTFQVAQANASSPTAAQEAASDNQEVNKYLVPMDWDRRHTLNGHIGLDWKGRWGLSLLGTYGSGLPYTPVPQSDDLVVGLLENSGRKPFYLNFDLSGWWNLPLGLPGSQRMQTHFQVKNLFDRLNENNVYDRTGRAGYNLDWEIIQAELFVNPTNYSRPREVIVGLKYSF